jgi:hypothetical protein
MQTEGGNHLPDATASYDADHLFEFAALGNVSPEHLPAE